MHALYVPLHYAHTGSTFALCTSIQGHEERDYYLRDSTVVLASNQVYCLSFWYYIWGSGARDVGRLMVNYGLLYDVWKREGQFGQRWLHGQVQIDNPIESPLYTVSPQ